MEDHLKFYKVQILGKVQGVAFRYYGKVQADELGVLGTIQNLRDGSVRAIVAGNQAQVDKFIDWCRRGSPASNVENVIVTELSAGESLAFEDFSILRQ